MAGLFGIDPDLLANVGMGLLAAGGKNLAGQGNVGTALQGAVGNYYAQKQAKQGLQIGNLDLQSKQLQMRKTQQLLDMVGGLMGPPGDAAGGAGGGPAMGTPGGTPPMTPAPPMSPPAQPMSAPQSAPGAPQGSAPPPAWLTPPSQSQVAQTPIGGMNPRLLQGYDLLSGKDPLASSKELESAQFEQQQRKYAPALGKLDTLIKSDNPAKYATADPDLKSAWSVLAQQYGFDPKSDFNDKNVRTAFTFARNHLASSIGKDTISPIVQEQTKSGPLGSIYQTDPLTQKTTQVKGEEELQQVVGKDGQPTLVPKSQAVGMTPFNASIYGAANITDQAKEMAYQRFVATGEMPAVGRGGMQTQVAYSNYFAKRAAEDGNTGAAMAAKSQQYKASQGVIKGFESGKESQQLTAINTAVKHMDNLSPLIDALGNGNLTIQNKVQQFFKQQTGSPAPTNYAAIKEFVLGEVAKAVLPGGGGEAERQALGAPLAKANSPAQLKQAVGQIQQALAGKTEALRNQWDVGTSGTQGSFDKFLLPGTKKALGINATPADSDLATAAAAELARRGH